MHRYGQLGNRLAYLKAFLAIAMEYRLSIANFTFDEYARYFKGTCADWAFGFPASPKGRRLPRFAGRLLRVLLAGMEPVIRSHGRCLGLSAAETAENGCFMFTDGRLAAAARRRNLVFYKGWPVVPPEIMAKHADQIREYFALSGDFARTVATYLAAARQGCDLLVGIHVRQGDYQHWNGGRFYYSTPQYAVLMQHIVRKHAGRQVRFVVCSNVVQDWSVFAALPLVRGTGEAVVDLYVLSGCDEIYGPQSSYSAWAAYYGQKPLYWVMNPETFELVGGSES